MSLTLLYQLMLFLGRGPAPWLRAVIACTVSLAAGHLAASTLVAINPWLASAGGSLLLLLIFLALALTGEQRSALGRVVR